MNRFSLALCGLASCFLIGHAAQAQGVRIGIGPRGGAGIGPRGIGGGPRGIGGGPRGISAAPRGIGGGPRGIGGGPRSISVGPRGIGPRGANISRVRTPGISVGIGVGSRPGIRTYSSPRPYYGSSISRGSGIYGYGYRGPSVSAYRYGYYPPSVSVYGVAPQLRYPRVPLYTTPVVPSSRSYYGYGYRDPLLSARIDIGSRYGRDDFVYPVPDSRLEDYEMRDLGNAPLPQQSARPPIDQGYGAFSTTNLKDAAAVLQSHLADRQDDADVWLDYLAPQRIIDSIDAGESPESLFDVYANYEGVVGNSDLGWIWNTPGFRETHRLLAEYVGATEDLESDMVGGGTVGPTPAAPIRSPSDDDSQAEEIALPEPVSLLDGVQL